MKRHVALLAVLPLLTALCGFGSTRPHKAGAHKMIVHKIAAQRQFHFPPTKGRGLELLQRHAAGERKQAPARGYLAESHTGVRSTTQTRVKPRKYSNPPISQIGFVSAAQIPAGGYLKQESLAGYFTNDGNPGVLSLVGDPLNPGTFYFSVVESNGDGTFKAAVWTPTPGNVQDPYAIGDLDGDGLDDIVFVHQPGTNGVASSNFDVLFSNGDGTFSAGNNYVIGPNSLSGGALGVDQTSGFLDVVAVDSATPGNVWTVTGNGDGTFSATPTSVALSGPVGYDVTVADLNGDGMMDVTANDQNSGVQMVYLATSPTAYAAGVSVDTSDGVHDACSTTVGDLNGDGFPEIVNANCGDNTITIFVNNGDGTFGTGTYYNVATNVAAQNASFVFPEAVAIGDVNGDGLPDIVSTNSYSGDVTVLLGGGDGTVQSPSVGFALGGYPNQPALVADFNGDGLADIIVPDDLYSLAYMKGYGDGTFRAGVDYYSPISDGGEATGYDIATGDFNGDGFTDVVVGNCCDTSVGITVFLSRGDGSLQPGVNYGSGGGLAFVAVADFDGDGKLDIAASDFYNGVVQIFSGDGQGNFTVGATYATDATNTNPEAIVVADFNGDGKPDVAVANFNGSNIGVLLNDGEGGFGPPANYAICSSTWEVTAADINGDGYPDLLAPLPSCTGMAVILNAADGTGTFNPSTDFGVGNSPWQVAVGDLNGDGKADLAITMDDPVNGHGVAIALGNGDGTFQAVNIPAYPTTLEPNYYSPYPSYIRLVDLDGDGKLDLVYSNSNFGTVGVMYGVGDGTFYDPVEYASASDIFGLALGDLNGDGALDVVTAVYYTSGVTTLINNSGTGAAPNYAISANPSSATVTAGGSGTFTFTLTPRNFYNGTVTFSCGTLPSKTTCVFSNPTLTPNGNGVMTTTLTLKTTATTTTSANLDLNLHRNGASLLATFAGMGVFGLMLAGDWRKKSGRRLGIILTLVALGMMLTLVGCGGSSSNNTQTTVPGTPTGSYTVTVTATGTAGTNGGSTAAHPVNVTLTVQ